MITYNWRGEPFYSERDILVELSQKHDTTFIDDGIRKSGYEYSLKIGTPEVAEIEIFFSTSRDTEFSAIAMVSLGDNIEGYVFSKHHDAMVFLKEFTPMIESINRVHQLTKEEK